jgi:hypothetical protein
MTQSPCLGIIPCIRLTQTPGQIIRKARRWLDIDRLETYILK